MAVRTTPTQKTEATHVFLVLWKTYRAMLAKANESKKKLGLGDSDFRVLEALLHKGPLPVNVIGEKVELTTGSITTAVDRMEAKWLVVRKNHPEDRRVRIVELTPKGRRLIEKAYAQHEIDMEKVMKVLSREERVVLVDLLKRLAKREAESRGSLLAAGKTAVRESRPPMPIRNV
jgi:MarR family transcriptional regulator, 2-MHQ and catechol-resistance regulon repressor